MEGNITSLGRLDGKVALITGASSGIGAGTAILFSKLGAELCITGRNEANLRRTSEECTQINGKQPLMVVADLVKDDDVKRLLDEAIKRFGRLDILVNNAGRGEGGTIETTSLAQYDRVMNINARSVFYLTKLAVPHLIKTKGCIVNVSSVNGIRAFPGVLAYCMSKSVVDQFTRCLALELSAHQVRVNSVNPGVVDTDINRRAGLDEKRYQQFLERCKITHALGRHGNVREIATTIAFLASEDSSFTTGAQVSVDGGRHAMVLDSTKKIEIDI